jgi:hypothetical protein
VETDGDSDREIDGEYQSESGFRWISQPHTINS